MHLARHIDIVPLGGGQREVVYVVWGSLERLTGRVQREREREEIERELCFLKEIAEGTYKTKH